MRTNKPEEADLIIQKLPSDMGIHRNPRKGTLNAPGAILGDYHTDKKVLIDEVFPDEFSLEKTHRKIAENTSDLLKYNKPIISVGGDHSVSFPVISRLKRKHPEMQLIWLDSHLDLKEKVDEHVSHDVVVRELIQNGFSEDEIYFVGITKVDHDEEEFQKEHDLNIYHHDEIEKFKREFNPGEQPCYLSIDIDVLRKELAPGTGYPDGKVNVEDVEEIIANTTPNFADLVEVAPTLDKDRETVQNARNILNKLITTIQY